MKIERLKVKEFFGSLFDKEDLVYLTIVAVLLVTFSVTYNKAQTWERCQDSTRVVKAEVLERLYNLSEGNPKFYFIIRKDVDGKINTRYSVSPELYYSDSTTITFTETRKDWDPRYFDPFPIKFVSYVLGILLVGLMFKFIGYNKNLGFLEGLGFFMIILSGLGIVATIGILL